MEIKNVNKTQLRDFIDRKIAKRKTELYDEMKATVTERLGVALKSLLGDTEELERVADRFEDLLTEKIHLVGSDSVPGHSTTTASNANKLCNAHKYFLDEIVANAMDVIRNSNRYYRFKCEPLVGTFNELHSELQPKIKLYQGGLETLKNELHTAVTNESTGKKAYIALVALGVDMSDLPESNPNLPAVIKLSIDVCAINGTCEEKAS